MRSKLIAVLVSACALAGVLVGPASASAATLTLNNALEEPATVADFPNGTGMIGVNGPSCEKFELGTSITKNAADPVTLQITGGTLSGCKYPGTAIPTFSEIQSPSGSPIKLNAKGTGELPIRLSESVALEGGGSFNCVRQGTLALTYSEGIVSFKGGLWKVSGSSFCLSVYEVKGSFAAATDEFGAPINWVITP